MSLKVGNTKSPEPPFIFVETERSGFGVPSMEMVMALLDASICHWMQTQALDCVGAEVFQLVQSPVGPPSEPAPQKEPLLPEMYCPPMGRTLDAFPVPASSTIVKCA